MLYSFQALLTVNIKNEQLFEKNAFQEEIKYNSKITFRRLTVCEVDQDSLP